MNDVQETTEQVPTPVPQTILVMAEIIGLGLYPAIAAYGLWTFPPTQFPLIIGLFILSMPLIFFGMTLIHELGHLIAGKIVGLTFTSIYLGKLTLQRTQGVLRVQVNRQGSWRGGGVSAVPQTARQLRARMCLYILGGPLFAIGVGIVGFAATTTFVAPAFQPALWWLALYLCIVMGVAQFLPVTVANYYLMAQRTTQFTDGRLLAKWWHGDPAIVRALALQVIAHAFREGCAPRDFSIAWLDQATAVDDDQIQAVLAHSLALGAALARGDEAAIRRHLGYFNRDSAPLPLETARYIHAGIACYLPQQRGPFRPNILLHAILSANEHEDVANARIILDRLPAAMPPELRGLYLHASAMTLDGEGRQDVARELLDRALAESAATEMIAPLSAEEIATLQQLRARIAPDAVTVRAR